jgi:hypothetical protein
MMRRERLSKIAGYLIWLQNEAIVGGVDSVVEQLKHYRDNGFDQSNVHHKGSAKKPEALRADISEGYCIMAFQLPLCASI